MIDRMENGKSSTWEIGKTQIQSVANDRVEINHCGKQRKCGCTNIWTMFSERGFMMPDIEMLGRLILEKDSIVVGKRGQRRPTLFCVKQGERGRAWRRCSGYVAAFSRVLQCTPKDVLSVDETDSM